MSYAMKMKMRVEVSHHTLQNRIWVFLSFFWFHRERWRVRVRVEIVDGGWGWWLEIGDMEGDGGDRRWSVRRGLRLKMEGEGEIGDGGWGWDRRWRVKRGLRSERWRVTVEIGDGGWGEGFWSEIEGEAKVEIGDGGWGEGFDRRWRVRVMASNRRDGGWDRRWRLGRWSGSSEIDGDLEGDRALGLKMCLKKYIYTWPKAAILTYGYRHNLRLHVKNATP